MRMARWMLMIGTCGLALGCAEEGRVPTKIASSVQVSKAEPGPWCKQIGALDGRTTECEGPVYELAYEALRRTAYERGGNYVVLDWISGPRPCGVQSATMVLHGRVYSCPLGGPYQAQVLPPPSTSPPQACAQPAE